MNLRKKVTTWIVDHPFHIVRYVAALLFLSYGLSKLLIPSSSEAGGAMTVLVFLFFLILALSCILPDIIKPVTGFLSSVITRAVYPNESAKKMTNDPRLADHYFEHERYHESLHEFERLHDDYPTDYYILSQIVKLHKILEDEKSFEKYSEKLRKLDPPKEEVVEEEEAVSAKEEFLQDEGIPSKEIAENVQSPSP